MGNSIYKQAFSVDFTGINAECSAIEPDSDEVSRAVNMEWAPGNSLRGRTGCQIASPAARFFAVHTHTYSRTFNRYMEKWQVPSGGSPYTKAQLGSVLLAADGSTVTEWLGFNDRPWRYEFFDLAVTQTPAGNTFSYYAYPKNGKIYFTIYKGATQILDFDCGTGMEEWGTVVTYYQLAQAINALADLSLTLNRDNAPPYAISSANQSTLTASPGFGTWGRICRIAVNAGHNFYPGDYISFIGNGLSTGAPLLCGGLVCATAANSIDYYGGAVNVLANQVLGYLGQPAAMITIDPSTTKSTSPFSIAVPYWKCLPCPIKPNDASNDSQQIHVDQVTNQNNPTANYLPPTFTSVGGNCYYAVTDSVSGGVNTYPYKNKLFKYDGQSVYGAGLPAPVVTLGSVAGAVIPAGTYRYKVRFKRVDANGNITYSPSTSWTVVLGAGVAYISVTITPPLYSAMNGYVAWSGLIVANAPPAGRYQITDMGGAVSAFIHVGDYICFNLAGGGAALAGALVRSWVTEVDHLAGFAQVQLADTSAYATPFGGSPVSAGLSAEIYRTTSGGTTYYWVGELAISNYSMVGFPWIDSLTDATIVGNAQLVEPAVGKEYDPPPRCGMVAEHQGGLVLAGNNEQPNTVYFSSVDGPEYFPLASNSFDVPSTQQGSITCLASDNYDRLSVFKAKSYYDVVGILDEGTFSVNIRHEGDFGVPSPAGICRINGALIGVSTLGLIKISNGEIDHQVFRPLNARMIGQGWKFEWARAANHAARRQAYFVVPTTNTRTAAPYTIDCETYVIDYSRPQVSFLEHVYTSTVGDSGGYAINGDLNMHLNRDIGFSGTGIHTGQAFRSLRRFSGNSPTGNDGICFVDNSAAITYVIESQPINFGEPSQLKVPIRLRLYSIPNDYIAEGWLPFRTTLETTIFPDASYFGGANPGSFTGFADFLTSHDWYRDFKFGPVKCFLYMVRFTTNTLYTAPFITGWEIMFKDTYEKEDIVKP